MTETARRRVLVIGGGLSGAAVAYALLSRARAPLLVTVVGKAPLGEGTAYGSSHPLHLLNVRSRGMSLVDGDDAHFVRWLATQDGADPDPDRFVPRRLYADYVRDTLAVAEASSMAGLERILGNVVGLNLTAEGVRPRSRTATREAGTVRCSRSAIRRRIIRATAISRSTTVRATCATRGRRTRLPDSIRMRRCS
ncbi:MAG TPA: FAD/NAD(P)-binding protein [Candidatus Eisenbacteria bacterium]|nr:FAD/NAD(P)-binding protein [Candidatus Eisenbacteria bacterium]